jgi:acyl carrier protein
VRRTLIAGIRAEAPTLSGGSRSLSSATSDQISTKNLYHQISSSSRSGSANPIENQIKIKDLNQNSLSSRSLSANPIEKSEGQIKINSRSISPHVNAIEKSDVKFRDMNQISLSSTSLSDNSIEKLDEEIKSLASYVTTRIDESIKHGSTPPPLLFGSEVYVNTDPLFDTYSENIRLEVMYMVTNILKGFREVDEFQGGVEVTKDTHFIKDLGFDKWDIIDVIQALSVEFKLYIPYDIVSCQQAIDYINENRSERLSVREFREHIYITREFGESKSEFRRLFVPGVKERRNDTMGELHCQALSLNGYKPFKFFTDMKQRFWFRDSKSADSAVV